MQQPRRLARFGDANLLVCAYQGPVDLRKGHVIGRFIQVAQHRIAEIRPVYEGTQVVILYGKHASLFVFKNTNVRKCHDLEERLCGAGRLT